MWPLTLALLSPALAQDDTDAPEPVEEVFPDEIPLAPEPPPVDAADGRLLELASVLLDDRLDDATRMDAARDLAATGDPRVLPFLRAAALLDDPEVRAFAVRSAAAFDHPETVALADRLARADFAPLGVREAAIDVLAGLGREDAGRALHALADSRRLATRVRTRASQAFERNYPELAARLAPPGNPVELPGTVAGIVANGVAGGVLLSSVGAWGRLPAGTAIGAAGGGAIGVGTGWLYAATTPVTNGQGFAYASGVGWGLSAGLMAQWAIVPADHPDLSEDTRQNVGALTRVVGTAGGAVVGAVVMRKDPDPIDVLEVDLAGYAGSQIAWGASRMALGPDKEEWEVVDPQALGLENAKRDRIRTFSALAGTAAGLGAGAALYPHWTLEPGDALMGAVVMSEAAWMASWAPGALYIADDTVDGHAHAAAHLGLVVGLAATAREGTTLRPGAMAGYGAVSGNMLGAGLPLLLVPGRGDAPSQVMIPSGAVGTAAGALAARWVEPDLGDAAMIAVGVSLATAEATSIATVLHEKDLADEQQIRGAALTFAGASAVGLMAASPFVDPEAADMALLGASAAWGTWFGVMVPYGLELGLDEGDSVLFATVSADLFLVGGGVLISPVVDLEPKRTLGPQLGGVAGATLGALGAGLATDDGNTVAGAAVIGSVVGLAAGAGVTELVRKRQGERVVHAPRLDLPGTWAPTASPVVLDDGSLTVMLGVRGVGW